MEKPPVDPLYDLSVPLSEIIPGATDGPAYVVTMLVSPPPAANEESHLAQARYFGAKSLTAALAAAGHLSDGARLFCQLHEMALLAAWRDAAELGGPLPTR